MTESMLQSLMKLFALLATINVEATRIFSRNFVESYLKGQFSNRLVEKSLGIFDQYMEELGPLREKHAGKRLSILSVKILMICDEVNRELHLKSKYLILFSIIQFSKHFEAHSESRDEFRRTVQDAVDTIAEALMIDRAEYDNCRAFITERFFRIPDRQSLLVVSGMQSFRFTDIKHIYKEGLKGQFFFLKIAQADLHMFYYSGNETFELAGRPIFPNHVYVFPKGSAIRSEHLSPVYYGDIVTCFRRSVGMPDISFFADRISYSYPGSDNGIHEISLAFGAGEMIGVMGGSGTGKSTLMGVLNGNIPPDSGTIDINGKVLHSGEEGLEGIMGYVPQDDLLIEELSVYKNLYYNAKLCLGDLEEAAIRKRIDQVLNDLGLFYIKDLKVGSPLNKFISGGQRKRLNIALELIREPYVLFVDEPTSGLSSTDSENVLTLLKDQALSGKIIVINIHQPSSEMFKLFDKVIILDRGGYPVYVGNPLDSVSYLKSVARRADAEEIQCLACGNIQTDEILKILEAKKVNEFGEFTRERLLEPKDWYRMFREKVAQPEKRQEKARLPELNFKVPPGIRQFWIYSQRNFFTKLSDQQFVTLSLSITPLLALILAFFTKYLGGYENGNPEYVFSLNENIPAYLFMSVIVSLFVGMIISAEEVIRDQKIRAREAFLNLSKYAYFNSKIVLLFLLSAFQMLMFVVLGNGILEIRGLGFNYWLILFSTSCFAVMLGLNISAGLKSVVSIYIVIPFVLVPLILLSGVIVKYDKLHPKVAGMEYVPVVGDMMASRWAYEALVVNQFKNNAYEKHFFDVEKERANALYNINFLIPELQNRIRDLRQAMDEKDKPEADRLLKVLNNATPFMDGLPPELSRIDPKADELALLTAYLDQWKKYLVDVSGALLQQKESILKGMMKKAGAPGGIVELKQDHQNEAVEDLVLRRDEFRKVVEHKGKLIRKDTPIFQESRSRAGRSQFFAASKYIGNMEVDTVRFNVIVLWLMTLFLYIALVNNWLRRLLKILAYKR